MCQECMCAAGFCCFIPFLVTARLLVDVRNTPNIWLVWRLAHNLEARSGRQCVSLQGWMLVCHPKAS